MKRFFILLLINIFLFAWAVIWAFDCKYFSFSLPGNQSVKVGDSGVYIDSPEGKVYVDDNGVKVVNEGNTKWVLIDNRDRTSKEGDYYVFYQHSNYKVNLKVVFYTLGNQFYDGYMDFINSLKSKEGNVQVTKTTIPNDYNRIVYKVVVIRDNGTKSVFYTVSSDEGFYVIEFSGKTEYVSALSQDLKYVIDTFIPKY